MPPKKFPSQAEREALIEQLRQAAERDEGLKTSEHYQNYIQSLGKLNEQLDKYYEPDENGAVSALEQEGKDELMTALAETATLGETFLADAASKGDDLNAGVPDMVGKVQEMLSHDYETLGVYDPKEGEMSLPELQQDARTQVVDLRGVKLGKLGNAQSSRLPMTVVGATGEKRRGVFTKASYVSIKQPFQKMLDKAAEQCGNGETKEKLKNFVSHYRDGLEKYGIPVNFTAAKNATDEELIGSIFLKMWQGKGDEDALKKEVSDIFEIAGLDAGSFSGSPRRTLTKEIMSHATDAGLWMNGVQLKLKEGERLDQRNSAMSAVAGLLGVSKLVARANNMKCIDEDGNVVEGTFMDFAEGVDLMGKDGFEEFSRVSMDPFQPPCKMNVALADLQVLDYLCGNMDRHAGNMTYRINENGKFTGLQAIDNDSSFGLGRPRDVRSIKVITTGMADKIDKMTPEMLKFTLRGRGLGEAEIDAACGRLEELKGALQKSVSYKDHPELKAGTMHRIEPADLERVNIGKLKQGGGSLFESIEETVIDNLREARQSGYAYDPALNDPKAQKKKQLKQVDTTDRRYTAAGISQSMRGVENLLHNEVTGFEVSSLSKLFRSSDNYRLMVTEMKNAAKLAKEIKGEIDKIETDGKKKFSRDDKAVEEQRKKADEAMARVERANDAYLAKKMREKGFQWSDEKGFRENLEQLKGRGKNEYEQKRIDYALKVRASVQEYKRLNAPEAQTEKDAVKQRLEIQRKQPKVEQKQQEPALTV
ncbi:MAG: hypothetical protein IJT71_02110, partial [Oscillospiraceae bacterium]|nr:hypothetical protein [Oscillospiraceae bacterium]